MFFQMGFMRRFDAGYAAAKKEIEAGRIGQPLVFKATSRDPFRPSLEYANPASSGGMLIDMGIHDFDLARWFMGDVQKVSAIGATIAYPELATVGDIDNAIASLTFTSGKLGVVDLTRSGIYGYDISTEILGLEGTIRIGYLRETPIVVMTKAHGVSHDTVPYFMERFRDAYTNQLQNFAQNVLQGRAGADHDRRRDGGAARRGGRDPGARERRVCNRGRHHRVVAPIGRGLGRESQPDTHSGRRRPRPRIAINVPFGTAGAHEALQTSVAREKLPRHHDPADDHQDRQSTALRPETCRLRASRETPQASQAPAEAGHLQA